MSGSRRSALRTIRAALGPIADAVVGAIQREVPDYARPLEGDFGRGIRRGTEVALRRFIGDEQDDAGDDVYRRLGGGEYRAGRSLDALQSAYRVGARVAWREISDLADAAGASARSQRNLAEAMFAYIDRIAGESVEGYAAAQLRDAGDLDRRRSDLAEMLLSGVAEDDAELVRMAETARWPMPRTVACLVVAGEQAERAKRLLSGESLGVRSGETIGIVVPHPGRARARGRAARAAARAPCRRRSDREPGRGSLLDAARPPGARAGRAERARPCSRSAGSPRSRCAALRRSRRCAAACSRRSTARRPRAASGLEATLLQWLRHRGAQGAIAAELGVHPQTVRYRMARLRDLMGETLEDPEQRFALEMALRGGLTGIGATARQRAPRVPRPADVSSRRGRASSGRWPVPDSSSAGAPVRAAA